MTSAMQWKTDSLIKFFLRRFLPNPALSRIKIQFELLRQAKEPRVVKAPEAMRVTVLSPHPDDEVIGCGGTLAISAKTGSQVSVVFLADGSKGYDPSEFKTEGRRDRLKREADLVKRRKQEAVSAGEIIEVKERVFLDFQDYTIDGEKDKVERLANVLRRSKPQIVFLPFLIDPHPDHWMTNVLFIRAADRASLGGHLHCWGYEVWSPFQCNTVVDITDVIGIKNKALSQYKSQLVDMDFLRVVSGLNTYRSLLCRQGKGFAEGFFVAELDVYRGIYEAALLNRNK